MAPSLSPRDKEILNQAKNRLGEEVQRYHALANEADFPSLKERFEEAAADSSESLALLDWAENDLKETPKMPDENRVSPQTLVWKPFPKPDSRTRGGSYRA